MVIHVLAMIWGLACGPGQPPPCVDNGDCSSGEACIAEECSSVECLVPTDCPIQNYCSDSYTCLAGCSLDGDCEAGESCDAESHLCEPYGCRSTELDCGYGEFCDPTTQSCYSEGTWCATCNPANVDSCGGDTYCIPYDVDGPGYCWNFCSADADCPRGFYCTEFDADFNSVCVGDCPWMTENGYL